MDEHIFWRRDFHPEDKELLNSFDKTKKGFIHTLDKSTDVLLDMSSKLKESSDPWFSERYLGHMNSDTLMIANLAYMATILYNPNNVSYESSVATSQMEIDVGEDLALMLGYDPNKSWGHITCDGTLANYESVWLARNLKSFPLAVKKIYPNLVEDMDEWKLLNLPVGDILDLISKIVKDDEFDFEKVRMESARGIGAYDGKLGVLLVPQTKHYSWVKAVDILGLGQKNLIEIPVDNDYHMDLNILKNIIDEKVANKIPILGLVGVVGTTEEGAIDKLNEIVSIREEYSKKGINFYLHWDAAYGGYSRSLYLDNENDFMNFDYFVEKVFLSGAFLNDIKYPSRELYESYKAMPEADSMTVDPHKMGYIPYAAGGIVIKDKRILDLVSYEAAYVFGNSEDNADLLGNSIMEGSKSGAAAAAVWASHRAIPLNISGYGQIVGRSIEAARILTEKIKDINTLKIDNKEFLVEPLCLEPDFNIVCLAFNEKDNDDLKKMNDLNMEFYNKSSFVSGRMFSNDWITSHTVLSVDDYGDAPVSFIKRLGISKDEWDKNKSVTVVRLCTLNPFLSHEEDLDELWTKYIDIWKEKIKEIASQK